MARGRGDWRFPRSGCRLGTVPGYLFRGTDNDGTVGISDFLGVLMNWGLCDL